MLPPADMDAGAATQSHQRAGNSAENLAAPGFPVAEANFSVFPHEVLVQTDQARVGVEAMRIAFVEAGSRLMAALHITWGLLQDERRFTRNLDGTGMHCRKIQNDGFVDTTMEEEGEPRGSTTQTSGHADRKESMTLHTDQQGRRTHAHSNNQAEGL